MKTSKKPTTNVPEDPLAEICWASSALLFSPNSVKLVNLILLSSNPSLSNLFSSLTTLPKNILCLQTVGPLSFLTGHPKRKEKRNMLQRKAPTRNLTDGLREPLEGLFQNAEKSCKMRTRVLI